MAKSSSAINNTIDAKTLIIAVAATAPTSPITNTLPNIQHLNARFTGQDGPRGSLRGIWWLGGWAVGRGSQWFVFLSFSFIYSFFLLSTIKLTCLIQLEYSKIPLPCNINSYNPLSSRVLQTRLVRFIIYVPCTGFQEPIHCRWWFRFRLRG